MTATDGATDVAVRVPDEGHPFRYRLLDGLAE